MLPQFMQVLLHYPVMTAGLLIIPRGIAVTLAMVLGPRLLRRYDSRAVLLVGLAMVILSLWLQTNFSLDMDMHLIIWSGFAQGIGVGFAIATGNMMSMANLPVHLRTEGAAIYMLARSVGTSILISIMAALLARNIQVNHEEVGANVSASAMPVLLPGMSDQYGVSSGMLTRMVDAEVNRQSMMIAYLDDFWLMMWLSILVIPVVLFLRRIRLPEGPGPAMVD
jgi:DHA2 family multidrug resistance protein